MGNWKVTDPLGLNFFTIFIRLRNDSIKWRNNHCQLRWDNFIWQKASTYLHFGRKSISWGITLKTDYNINWYNQNTYITACYIIQTCLDDGRIAFKRYRRYGREHVQHGICWFWCPSGFLFTIFLSIVQKGFNSGSYHLAITGKCWSVIQEHYSDMIPEFVVKGTIFARMSPDQKQQLVQALQKTGYFVGKCCRYKIVINTN